MWGSFTVKLVSRFLALSLLALATAYWSFSAVADRTVTNGADGRLEAGVRAAVRLVRSPAFARALDRRDRRALARLLRAADAARVEAGGGFRVATANVVA